MIHEPRGASVRCYVVVAIMAIAMAGCIPNPNINDPAVVQKATTVKSDPNPKLGSVDGPWAFTDFNTSYQLSASKLGNDRDLNELNVYLTLQHTKFDARLDFEGAADLQGHAFEVISVTADPSDSSNGRRWIETVNVKIGLAYLKAHSESGINLEIRGIEGVENVQVTVPAGYVKGFLAAINS